MSTRASNRVGQKPDHVNAKGSTVHLQKQESAGGGNTSRRLFSGNCRLVRRFSPLRFLKRFGYKMVTAIRLKRKASHEGAVRSKSSVSAPPDPHRSEAIEDCIQFINSSSFTKSHSVSATTTTTTTTSSS